MRRAAIAVVALALAGCQTAASLLEAKKIDYKSSGTLPTLEIPPDLTTPARDNRYVVPDTGKSSATLSGYQADRAQQAKTGSLQWLVVDEPPEKLWPLVRDFWQENGFLIALNVPEAGVMETDWAENRA